jgi:hypothetical protein
MFSLHTVFSLFSSVCYIYQIAYFHSDNAQYMLAICLSYNRILRNCPLQIIWNYMIKKRPPLWSSGQSSWLQIRRPRFDSRHYQKKKSNESGTGSTQPCEHNWGATWQKSSGSCLENREYGRRDPSRWPRGTLYPHKLAITSPTSSGRSVGIVCSWTQTMEFMIKKMLFSFCFYTGQ